MFLNLDSIFDSGRQLMNAGIAMVLLIPAAIVFFEVRDWLAPRLGRWWRALRTPRLYDGTGRLIDPDKMPEYAGGATPRLGVRDSSLDRHVRRPAGRLVASVTGSSLHGSR